MLKNEGGDRKRGNEEERLFVIFPFLLILIIIIINILVDPKLLRAAKLLEARQAQPASLVKGL